MEGRYVTVVLPGVNKVLTLCEVEVYGHVAPTGENLSLRGIATQSSTYPGGIPYNAIDGNGATGWGRGSCTHTEHNVGPWWRLDLRKPHMVLSIGVTNRDIVSERLRGAEIRIGNSLENEGNSNVRCGVITNVAGGFTNHFECGMEGRYVNIVIPGRQEYLTLCEVEVYGFSLE
ncbi:fucolectin-5-like [Diretmus argenteus]